MYTELRTIKVEIELGEFFSDDNECLICDRQFSNEKKVIRHMATHTDKEFADW